MQGPHSRRNLGRAVNGAAVLGWAAVTIRTSGPVVWFYPIAALAGLPVAPVTCRLVGAPSSAGRCGGRCRTLGRRSLAG
jgi:hypothetical protein